MLRTCCQRTHPAWSTAGSSGCGVRAARAHAGERRAAVTVHCAVAACSSLRQAIKHASAEHAAKEVAKRWLRLVNPQLRPHGGLGRCLTAVSRLLNMRLRNVRLTPTDLPHGRMRWVLRWLIYATEKMQTSHMQLRN